MGYLITIFCGTCNKPIARGDTVRGLQDAAVKKGAIIIPEHADCPGDGHVFHHPDCVVCGDDGIWIRDPDKLHTRKEYKERVKRGENNGEPRIDSNRTGTDND